MRKTLVTLILAGLAATFLSAAASADPYQWCAVYSGKGGSASNCGFVSLEQCRQTVTGIGGFCAVNQFYTGPEARPVKHARKRHKVS